MERYLHEALLADIDRKIILLSGPRQSGKTTLSRMLHPDHQYINHDLAEHRLMLREKSWDRRKALFILDELHKMENWKVWLKGVYDVEGLPPALVVTGSAKLAAFRKTGDSLAGRYFHFRLHPIDMKEALQHTDLGPDEAFKRLMHVGGFPEPFLRGSGPWYNRWKRTHVDAILKDDLLTLSSVRDIQSIETLIELLRSRVGTPLSANSLARDLQKTRNTVQHWLDLLEDLYVIFRVFPYHRNVARALLKTPKFYFYDNAMVQGDDGAHLENLVACALLKELHRAQDVEGEDLGLHYIRDKEGREIDFLVTRNRKPWRMIEVKWSDAAPSVNFKRFLVGETLHRLQVVGELAHDKSYPDGLRIEAAQRFLADVQLGVTTENA
ncbi:MAG: ATP-binding protein [Deltaproteobacteria bacterium]|nr:ATP-binding protein [Deltaproteobacteria bacterium]